MKRSDLSKLIGASAIGLGIAILPLSMPVSAQTDTAPGTTTAPDATTQTQPIQEVNTGDRDFDWGWLGLIGLAGLAGLSGKREEPVRYRDPDPVGTTPGYRE